MTKIKQEKKKEVFSYIEKVTKSKDLINLTDKKIKESFSKKYSEGEIDEIIEELKEDKDIIEDKISFEIYYPSRHKKFMKERIKHWKASPIGVIYVLITILWFIVLDKVPAILPKLLVGTITPLQIFIAGFILSIMAIFITSNIINTAITLAIDKKDLFYRLSSSARYYLIGSIVWIVIIALTLIFFQTHITAVALISPAILGIIKIISDSITKEKK
ncbi:MAG: hypothetical protein AABW73_00465 [Nanoarchaeota archaeon]